MALTYNGISLCYPRTEMNVMGPGMDASGSDQLYTVIKLKCRAIVSLDLSPALAGDITVADTLVRIRHMLTAPRRPLYYDLTSPPNTTGLFPVIDIPDGRDDANGPMPDSDAFSVTYTSPGMFEVSWAVTVKTKDCTSGGYNVPLSLRWEDTFDLGKDFRATYRRSGTLVLSSLSEISIDEWRRTGLSPPVSPGFAREKAAYTISRDGLRCDFQFIDVQVRWTPPFPAVDMDITQSETLPMPTGMREGEISVKLIGHIGANPKDLCNWALTIGYIRLNAATPLADDKGRIIGQGVFGCSETKDSVNCYFAVKYQIPPTRGGALGNIINRARWAAANPGVPVPPNAPLTKEGNPTNRIQEFPWVGYGTSAPSPNNLPGFADWADPSGQMNAPADGVGLAPAIRLYAALLRDPCGDSVVVQPYARQVSATVRTINTGAWNTPQSGQGGEPAVSSAQLSASLSTLNASQYPTTELESGGESLYKNDGEPGTYNDWQVENQYAEDPGTLVIPEASPDGVSESVNFASTQWTLRRRWVASRTGAPPKLPPKDPPDENWVYTGGNIGIRNMRLGADGVSYVYEASGIYEYMALDPTIVQPSAEVPPFISPYAMEAARLWAESTNSLSSGSSGGSGGSETPSLGGGILQSGGGSPLGSASLGVYVPN